MPFEIEVVSPEPEVVSGTSSLFAVYSYKCDICRFAHSVLHSYTYVCVRVWKLVTYKLVSRLDLLLRVRTCYLYLQYMPYVTHEVTSLYNKNA